jgi:hypothetical protein
VSAIEDRLLRDISTVTRGVVVTDSDLRDAWEGIDNRIQSDKHDRRRSFVAVAAAAVLVLVLGVGAFLTLDGDDTSAPPANNGPKPTPSPTVDNHATFLTGSAPTVEDLQAVWRLDNGNVLMRFGAPDLVSFDHDGRLFDNPGVQGRYTIDGDTVRITVDGGPYGCGGRQIAMRASVPEDGKLHLVITEQGEGACAGLQDQRLVMERMLPLSSMYADFRPTKEDSWLPLTDRTGLHGTWFAQRGGYLLELDPRNVYHVATGKGEQVDYGEWALEGKTLTQTSRPDSVECETGDKLVMRGVEIARPGTSAIRFTVGQNDCGGGWTPKSWMLIPYEGSD